MELAAADTWTRRHLDSRMPAQSDSATTLICATVSSKLPSSSVKFWTWSFNALIRFVSSVMIAGMSWLTGCTCCATGCGITAGGAWTLPLVDAATLPFAVRRRVVGGAGGGGGCVVGGPGGGGGCMLLDPGAPSNARGTCPALATSSSYFIFSCW